MRFLLSIILIAILSALAEYYLPWWTITVVSFVISLLIVQKPGKAFLMGFAGIGLSWLCSVLLRDTANQHILSGRMAGVLHLPNFGLFILVTVVVGALLGGLSAWAAALLRGVR